MLVVTRKAGERIHIGDDIVITIVDVRGDNVRIGIDAPRSLRIQRSEVLDWIQDETVAATTSTDTDQDTIVGILTRRDGPADGS